LEVSATWRQANYRDDERRTAAPCSFLPPSGCRASHALTPLLEPAHAHGERIHLQSDSGSSRKYGIDPNLIKNKVKRQEVYHRQRALKREDKRAERKARKREREELGDAVRVWTIYARRAQDMPA